MRRLVLALLIVGLFGSHQAPRSVGAVNYAAGWNLVAGPQGSTLSGATGNIYTLQPGDTDYQTFDAGSALHLGWGYWAYFPTGGGITFPGGVATENDYTTYTVHRDPVQFTMLGNPSLRVVDVDGANLLYTYTAAGGYQSATSLTAGQGAWVIASEATLTVRPGTSAQPAPPARRGPTTLAELRALSLTANDLPGYFLRSEEIGPAANDPGVLTEYYAQWVNADPRSPHFLIGIYLTAFPDAPRASQGLVNFIRGALTYSGDPNARSLGSQGVGDEDGTIFYTFVSSTGYRSDNYEIYFRRGSTLVDLYTLDEPGSGSLLRLISLARIIDARLIGH